MGFLIGEYECKMDTKGRMVVPAALKRQLPDVEREGLVVNRGFEKKLSYLYTWGVEQDLEAVVSFKSVSGKKTGSLCVVL